MVIISAEIPDAEEPRRIMEAVWEHLRFRWVIVVDDDCDVRNWNDVMWRVCQTAIPGKHIIQGQERGTSSFHYAEDDLEAPTSGMGIDATMRFKDARFPPVNKVSKELMSKVVARWKEYGLS
jgi:UbiD family decarboxylase